MKNLIKTLGIIAAGLIFPTVVFGAVLPQSWLTNLTNTYPAPINGTYPGLQIPSISGSTQCLHVNTSGVVSGTGADCGSGGGGSASAAQPWGGIQYSILSGTSTILAASSSLLFSTTTGQVSLSFILANSIATSTFTGGIISPCFATSTAGGCITGGGGSGTNFFANSGATTTLTTGSVLQASVASDTTIYTNVINLANSNSLTNGVIMQGGVSVFSSQSPDLTNPNIFVGLQSGSTHITTAIDDVGLGALTLSSLSSGQFDMAIGRYALADITSGSNDVAVGNSTLSGITTQGQDTAIGDAAGFDINGSHDVLIGQGDGRGVSGEYDDDTFLGTQAGYGLTNQTASNISNSTAIGYASFVGCSNCMVLGGMGTNYENVGIGTTTPNSALSVVGTTTMSILNVTGTSTQIAATLATTTITALTAQNATTTALAVIGTGTTTFGGGIIATCFATSTGNPCIVPGSSSGGAVSSVSPSGTTLTITPTTGAVLASLNLANNNAWSGGQIFTNASATTLFATTSTFGSITNNGNYTSTNGNVTLTNGTLSAYNATLSQSLVADYGGISNSFYVGGTLSIEAAADYPDNSIVIGPIVSSDDLGIDEGGNGGIIDSAGSAGTPNECLTPKTSGDTGDEWQTGCFSGGTNYWTNSGSNTYLNTGTNAQFLTFSATSTKGLSTVAGALSVGTTSSVAGMTIATDTDIDNGLFHASTTQSVITINTLQMGAPAFQTDSGVVTALDEPVDASATVGTLESYSFNNGGTPVLTIYGLSNGTGSTSNLGGGFGTTTPGQTLVDNGGFQLSSASSSVITPSISGAIIGLGCDSATSSVDVGISSSTTAFITTPQNYPGAGLTWQTYLSAPGVITTTVCSDVTVTPSASQYVVKIIR